MTNQKTPVHEVPREDWVECGCGHTAVQHHGIDPNDGCMVVGMRSSPKWCRCSMTCSEVLAAWDASPQLYLVPSHRLTKSPRGIV